MAKFITKHRRGTISQWVGKIPEEGELVLEQNIITTSNSDSAENYHTEPSTIYKIKIGDGRSKYEDLPYIDTKLAAELLLTKGQLTSQV